MCRYYEDSAGWPEADRDKRVAVTEMIGQVIGVDETATLSENDVIIWIMLKADTDELVTPHKTT